MTKILYIITQSEFGGAQRYVFDLATNLDKSQFEVHIAAGLENGELFRRLQSQNLSIHKLKYLDRAISPFKDLKSYYELKKLIKKINSDIVHLNSSKAGVLGSIAAKELNIKKIIYTAHGFVFNEPMNPLKKWLYKKAELSNAKRVHKVITVSEYDRRAGIKTGMDEHKLIIIHNGIDSDKINFLSKEKARARLGIASDKPVVGCIANFYPSKGLDILINSMDTINAQLVIVGDGELRSQLEAQIKILNLSNRVKLTGSIPDAHQYLKAFDVFVLPSRKEGLPYVLLEAAVAQIPIVTTQAGGVPEIIQDNINGYLAAADNSKELAQKINLALSNPLDSKLTQNFTFEKMIKKTVEVYKS
jgi:glycosyltransferase involved in cell wall biosynthesis